MATIRRRISVFFFVAIFTPNVTKDPLTDVWVDLESLRKKSRQLEGGYQPIRELRMVKNAQN